MDRLYRCVTSCKMRETIEIDFKEKFGLTIPCIEDTPSDKYSVYLAIISGSLLAELYREYMDRLLEKNVRSFLQVKLSSAVGFRGICKKVLILMLVGVSNILDVHVIGTGSALRGAVICFYLSNEGLSLLETAGHIGLPIPDKLKDILAQLHNRDDKKEDEN